MKKNKKKKKRREEREEIDDDLDAVEGHVADDDEGDGDDEVTLARRSDVSAIVNEATDEPLTAKEAVYVREYVTKGRVVFLQLKWDAEREMAFLARPSVQREVRRYEQYAEYGEAIMARQVFFGTIDIGNSIPEAINVIKRHLRGLTPDANGVKPDANTLPDSEQVETAWRILNACGVGGKSAKELVMAGLALQTNTGPDLPEEERYGLKHVMRREKVRNVLGQIVNMAASAEDSEKRLLDERIDTKKRKAERKAARRE